MLGAALVAATVLVAVRSPRRAWIWHLCLISGLALSAAGGIFLELLPEIRGNFGLLHLDKSLHSFRWEEFLEFLGIWLALVAMLGQYSDAAPTPQPRVRRLVLAIPLLWILLLLLNSLFPRLELRYIAKPASVAFESGIQLRGYRMEKQEGAFVLRLYASATQRDYLGLGYSVHLVDQVSGDSIASRNEYASRQESVWLFGPDYAPVYRQSTTVMIPPQSPSNRALWVVMSLWRGADDIFVPQKVISSDHQMLNDTQVVLSELVLPENSAASAIVPLAEFDNGFKLAIVNMPDRAQAGEIMSISFDWRSDAGGTEDYVQFLHLGHEDSGEWWAYDQQPLGPRLPTRLWYSGLADCETWEVPLPPDLAPGRYSVLTGLYRLRDKGRLPVVDADGTSFVDARVPLGILTIE